MSTLPQGWQTSSLGKHLSEISLRNKGQNEIPVLSVTNTQGFVHSAEYFDRQVFSKNLSNYKVISKGQFAYNPSRLNVGSIDLLQTFPSGLLSPMYVVFESDHGLNPSYLKYWFNSYWAQNQIRNSTQGTVRDSVNFSALADFQIKLPPPTEQQKIIDILGSVDEAISATWQMIEQTRELKRALLQQLLTQGIPGRHTQFKDSPLGQIPVEWEMKKLGELGQIVTGSTPSTKNEGYWRGDFPFATPGDVAGDRDMIFETERFMSVTGAEASRIAPKGSILVVCIGSTTGKSGMADRDMAFNQQINAIICGPMAVPYFVLLAVKTMECQISEAAGRHAVPIINKTSFSALQLALPSLEEQTQIAVTMRGLDERLQVNEAEMVQLTKLKNALLHKLLSGEVRVAVTTINGSN